MYVDSCVFAKVNDCIDVINDLYEYLTGVFIESNTRQYKQPIEQYQFLQTVDKITRQLMIVHSKSKYCVVRSLLGAIAVMISELHRSRVDIATANNAIKHAYKQIRAIDKVAEMLVEQIVIGIELSIDQHNDEQSLVFVAEDDEDLMTIMSVLLKMN